jgi:hypothetical protein
MPWSLSFSYIVTQASATVQVQLSNDSKVKKGSEQVESLSNGAELAVAWCVAAVLGSGMQARIVKVCADFLYIGLKSELIFTVSQHRCAEISGILL